jgi:hypothetical protein
MEEITHTPKASPANSTTTEVTIIENTVPEDQIVPGQLVEQAMSEHPESLCSNVRKFKIINQNLVISHIFEKQK